MIKCLAVLTLLVSAQAQAWGCKFHVELDQSLSVAGSESLAITAGAGELVISGVPGSEDVAIRARVCVSKKAWLEDVRVETTPGNRAEINVVIPDTNDGWSLWGNRYAYVDLVLEVPDSLVLQLRDSSGDIEIEHVAAVSVRDSSGDITISHASGAVEIEDSSGDIKVRDLKGDFTVKSDSSGDIRGTDIEGTVLVVADSSGDIRFSTVGQDVIVEKDSSGDIRVESIGGDFKVLKDGSGDIWSKNVAGEVVIPDRKQ